MISKLFYKIAKFAVGELAQNPELQAKTASFVKNVLSQGQKPDGKKPSPHLNKLRTLPYAPQRMLLKWLERTIQEKIQKSSCLKHPNDCSIEQNVN